MRFSFAWYTCAAASQRVGKAVLRVFWVEDESAIRETLRDTVPWEQYGYSFVGEAGDGEIALPMIRQAKPDVLITDIRISYMDGLPLSKLVLREFSLIKVVIISCHGDFTYARQTICAGSCGPARCLLRGSETGRGRMWTAAWRPYAANVSPV